METYESLNQRIASFQVESVPHETVFRLSPALADKITPYSGEYKPFFGDTVAYFLGQEGRDMIATVMNVLYERFGASLSVPLPLEISHVTLHDLRAGNSIEPIWREMELTAKRLKQLVREARRLGAIRTVGTAVFNLMNTSIAIGLTPENRGEHQKLLHARTLFDEIVPSALYTPHVTLAYYRPEMPDPLSPDYLRATLAELSIEVKGKLVVLEPAKLFALRFDAMNRYWEIP